MSPEASERRAPEGDILLETHNESPREMASALLPPAALLVPHKEAGLNPLVDAAARLFSLAGRLRQLKSCEDPLNLHADLEAEINVFQEMAKSLGYGPEYVLVSRYAICATLDDVIAETSWGAAGQWQACCQQGLFGTESTQHERFFLILERILLDPEQYIDLMEFMYICLSLGFRGHFRSSEFGAQRLAQISDTLYRQIRAFHGDFSRVLSPWPVKAASVTTSEIPPTFSTTLVMLMTASIILLLFAGLGFVLDTFSDQAHTQLLRIGNTHTHETIDL